MKRNAGFSLIEVLCAILILGIGLAGLTHGLATALNSNKEAELQTAAALLASGRIETLRADGFVIEGETEGECGEGLELYRWKESITRTTIDGLFEVEVRIENTQSGELVFDLRTLLFDPPATTSADEPADNSSAARRRERDRE